MFGKQKYSAYAYEPDFTYEHGRPTYAPASAYESYHREYTGIPVEYIREEENRKRQANQEDCMDRFFLHECNGQCKNCDLGKGGKP